MNYCDVRGQEGEGIKANCCMLYLTYKLSPVNFPRHAHWGYLRDDVGKKRSTCHSSIIKFCNAHFNNCFCGKTYARFIKASFWKKKTQINSQISLKNCFTNTHFGQCFQVSFIICE